MPLLDSIRQPTDVRSLSMSELTQLAGEMRTRIFDAVSKNGGHLASNLGVVELTLALHYVYDFGPYPAGPDRLLFTSATSATRTSCSPAAPGSSNASARRARSADSRRLKKAPTTCSASATPAPQSAPRWVWREVTRI